MLSNVGFERKKSKDVELLAFSCRSFTRVLFDKRCRIVAESETKIKKKLVRENDYLSKVENKR